MVMAKRFQDERVMVVTEAQLRWAHFRHKRRARDVREFVENLWQSPERVDDVEGALTDDGNTSEESAETKAFRRLHPKPSISRGRRALLRLSKRRYENRRRRICKHGFRSYDDSDSEENDDDALAAIFAEGTAWKKARKKRQLRRMGEGDRQRFRRFENAFRAMMMTLAAAQPQHPEKNIAYPTKRWSRPSGLPTFTSIDGREYQDLKWGVQTGHQTTRKALSGTEFASRPMDSGASWMVHLPSKVKVHRNVQRLVYTTVQNTDGKRDHRSESSLGSEIPRNFMEMVDFLQKQVALNTAQNNNTTHKLHSRHTDSKISRGLITEREEKSDKENIKGTNSSRPEGSYVQKGQRSSAWKGQLEAAGSVDMVNEGRSGSKLTGISARFQRAIAADGHASRITAKEEQQRVFNGIAARYLQEVQGDCKEEDLVDELQRSENQVFSLLLTRYLAEVKDKVDKSRIYAARSRTTDTGKVQALVSRYIESIQPTSRGESLATFDENEMVFQEIAAKHMAEEFSHCEERDVVTELRKKTHRGYAKLVTSYLDGVSEAIKERTRARQKSARMVQDNMYNKNGQQESDGTQWESRVFSDILDLYLDTAVRSQKNDETFGDLKDFNGASKSRYDRTRLESSDERKRIADESYVKDLVRRYLIVARRHCRENLGIVQNTKLNENALEQVAKEYLAKVAAVGQRDIVAASLRRIGSKSPESFEDLVLSYQASNREPETLQSFEDPPHYRSPQRGNGDGVIIDDEVSEVSQVESDFFSHVRESAVDSLNQKMNHSGKAEDRREKRGQFSRKPAGNSSHHRETSFHRKYDPSGTSDTFRAKSASISGKESDLEGRNTSGTFRVKSASVVGKESKSIDLEGKKADSNGNMTLEETKLLRESAQSLAIFKSTDEKIIYAELEKNGRDRAGYAKIVEFYLARQSGVAGAPEKRSTSRFEKLNSVKSKGIMTRYLSSKRAEPVQDEKNPNVLDAAKLLADVSGQADEKTILTGLKRLPESDRNSLAATVMEFLNYPNNGEQAETASSTLQLSIKNEQVSPSRSITSTATFSPESGKAFHQKVMEKSTLIGGAESKQAIIDTDGTTSDISNSGMDPTVLHNLLLSPTILTRRLKQAIQAIERHKWDQVSYLLNANPWLAEMKEMTSNQYLLHKLAFYGGGSEDNTNYAAAAPDQLCSDLIRLFPASLHKLDQDGNLPLHMAAIAGNTMMIKLLIEQFPSGTSVRNEAGMLPLHLGLSSPWMRNHSDYDFGMLPADLVRLLLGHFPGALAVADNTGNLPLHIAARLLRGSIGEDVVFALLEEAELQMKNPSGVRFRNKVKVDDGDSVSLSTEGLLADSSFDLEDSLPSTMVRNDDGRTPILEAIVSGASWEVIEALTIGPGGRESVLQPDNGGNNALHLLVGEHHANPAAALSILKVAPETALAKNNEKSLPIEIACMHALPHELILALVLVDLPIDPDDKSGSNKGIDSGKSWWFLTCDCDDNYFEVVEEVVNMCSYEQVQALCFMQSSGKTDSSVLSRATPRVQDILRRALRFVGRYEVLGGLSMEESPDGLKHFDAMDFGTKQEAYPEGRPVFLKCYASEKRFLKDTSAVLDVEFDSTLVEEVFCFVAAGSENDSVVPQQFCVSIEQPRIVLSSVVASMLENDAYRKSLEIQKLFVEKILVILHRLARALHHVHSQGLVHGSVSLDNFGKFDHDWKLRNTLEMVRMDEYLKNSSFGEFTPPEAIETSNGNRRLQCFAFSSDFRADRSFDIWSFGKLAHDVLVGKSLLDFDRSVPIARDQPALARLARWSDADVRKTKQRLAETGVSHSGIEMILKCLSPEPLKRPTNMNEVLADKFWLELRSSDLDSNAWGDY